jgi:uncharacterized cupin superfamily protein
MSTAERLSIFFLISLLLLSSLAFFISVPQAKAATLNWLDDFTDENARWDWAFYRGTGYHLLTTVDGYSVVENGITEASNALAYSDCTLGYLQPISASDNVTVEIRAKFSHSMTQGAAKGSQGTGLWDGTQSNFAMFFDCSNESMEGFTGLRALVTSGGTVYANEFLGDTYSPTDWHVYGLELNSSGTFMFVDGAFVVSTTYRPILTPLCQLTMWVDNAAYTWGTTTYLDVTENQRMYVDYVAYHSDSLLIPEFPSWTISVLFIVATVTLILVHIKNASAKQKNSSPF